MKNVIPVMVFCLLMSSGILSGEEFRGTVAASIIVPDPASEDLSAKASLSYLEIASIDIDPSTRFLRGIEIEFRIPKVIQDYPGSYVFYLYRNVKPALEAPNLSYSGDQLLMQILTQRISTIVQIPVIDNHGLKASPYTVLIKKTVSPADFPLALYVMPVMKGLPGEVEKAQFSVRVKPLYTDEGALKLQFAYPDGKEGKPLEVFIDNRKVIGPVDDLVLPSGLHYLKISSEFFRDEMRSFAIQSGRETNLSIAFQDVTPVLLLEAPENAHILFDAEKLDFPAKTSFQVTAGDHVIIFKVGDYTIQRNITIQKAKTYKVSLNLQIDVQEN